MNAQEFGREGRSDPIQELDAVEMAIGACTQCITALQARRECLTTELERPTRPDASAAEPPVTVRTIGPGFIYRGEFTRRWSYIDIHTGVLERLWQEYPEQREAMSRAMARCGTSRVYVARTEQDLFPLSSPSWALKHSRRLVEGWYIDTNINLERMRRILPAAVRAAGLRWGEDVRPYWRAVRPS